VLWKFFATFIKAVVVQIAALFFAVKPDFAAALRLAAVAAVPPAVLDFLLNVLTQLAGPRPFTLPFWLATLVWGGFVIYGLVAFNAEAKKGQG
jgi:hypothetical protein